MNFNSDLPFVTFAKIMEILFCMVEREPVNDLEDLADNRIHRAIYEKFESVIRSETPEQYDEKLKDVVDVLTGKIATWFRCTLTDCHIKFLDENKPVVESKELRNLSAKLLCMADLTVDWSRWVGQISHQVGQIGCNDKNPTRCEWKTFTSNLEENGLRWRRVYLQAKHEQHHDIMMIKDRQVVKTGEKIAPKYLEEVVEKVHLANNTFDCGYGNVESIDDHRPTAQELYDECMRKKSANNLNENLNAL